MSHRRHKLSAGIETVEHKFYSVGVRAIAIDQPIGARPAVYGTADPADRVSALRAQIERVQGRRLDAPVLPVHPVWERLLPDGGLRAGSVYALAPSSTLMLAMLAGPSRAGHWCAAIGIPELGAEAAEDLGVDLSRLVLIPDAGARWLAVAATVAEVMPVVAVRPAGRVTDGDVSRLAARLRDRGAALLVQGSWPQADAMLSLTEPTWSGLGEGHGYLAAREVTVTVSSRRWPTPRRARLSLPADDGAQAPAVDIPVAGAGTDARSGSANGRAQAEDAGLYSLPRREAG